MARVPIRLSLTARMVAALFGMSAVMVALVVLWAGWALDNRFSAYVSAATLAGMDQTAALLEKHYAVQGSWAGLQGNPLAWAEILRSIGPPSPFPPDGAPPGPPPGEVSGDWPPLPPPGSEAPWRLSPVGASGDWLWPGQIPARSPPGPPSGPPPDFVLHHIRGRLRLIDASGRYVAGVSEELAHPARRPITVGGKVVGALLFDSGPLPNGIEAAFLAERAHDLYLAATVALALSGLWAVLLARHILAPVRLVTAGAQRLASGVFSTRIDTGRRDELGDLVRDFNQLAVSLETAEQARRLWVADTSHELRTPLAVLRAQIEALQDGVHQATAQSLGRLHDEVGRMTRLVDDLHELARADNHALGLRLELVRPGEIMTEVLSRLAPQREAGSLLLDAAALGERGAVALADPDRLRQVFGNLVENAIRYTDPGGTISVSETLTPDNVLLRVEDSSPGVPDNKLPRLFERFFRVESSRNRTTGGSGLGLAICRAIVEAHSGTISAAASSLGGLAVTVTLPLARETGR